MREIPGAALRELLLRAGEAAAAAVRAENTTPRGGTPYRVIQYAVNPLKPS